LLLFLIWISTFFLTAHLIYIFLKQRKLSKTENLTGDTNIVGMIGQSCKIISLMPDGLYLVRYEFEEWTAESHDDDLLEIEEIVRIIRIVGNRIIIKKI
jgi:membrane protein implicated in regulation of membrane protease activity